jgi:hypothetical protein
MMLLEWIWFGVLTSTSTLIILLPIGQPDDEIAFKQQFILRVILASACTFIALVFSWEATGLPIRSHIEHLLPQKGTVIQRMTAGTLTLALYVVYLLVAVVTPTRIALTMRKRRQMRARPRP